MNILSVVEDSKLCHIGRLSNLIWRLIIIFVFFISVSIQTTAQDDLSIQLMIPKVVEIQQRPMQSLNWYSGTIASSKVPRLMEDHPGFALSQKLCVGCHLAPIPMQLPRKAWPFALTWMSNYLGYTNHYGSFVGIVGTARIPSEPAVTEAELQSLAEYFQVYSKTEVELREERLSPEQGNLFVSRVPTQVGIHPAGLISLVKVDEARDQIFLGWANENRLQCYSRNFDLLYELRTPSEPAVCEPVDGGFRYSVFGHLLFDHSEGQIIYVIVSEDGKQISKTIVQGWPRLADHLSRDVDGDGYEDLVVVGFGGYPKGKASIYWGNQEGGYGGEQILYDHDGGVKVECEDVDADGKLDLLFLVAQERQELIVMKQGVERSFTTRIVDKRFGGFGHNHFTMCDFNGDGLKDVVICSGNNLELPESPLKSHHGVRILKGLEGGGFEEQFFYPMFGALRSVFADFDLDGDQDIAAIAMYPDWELDLPETFVYLENIGNFTFRPYRLKDRDWGQWISIATMDAENDGDPDLILGGGYYPLGISNSTMDRYVKRIRNKPSVVLLENRSR